MINKSAFNVLKSKITFFFSPYMPSRNKYNNLYYNWHIKDNCKTNSRKLGISNKICEENYDIKFISILKIII